MLFNILATTSVVILIILLKRLVNIFPSLLACTIRWKESINLEASVKHSLDRDILAISMIIPFCLIADRFDLYAPGFMDIQNPDLRLAFTIGVFSGYIALRFLLFKMAKPKRVPVKIRQTGHKASLTFFIILTLILISMGGIMSFIGIESIAIKNAMLCVSAFIYLVHIIRKLQIFISGCSFFTAFLYLCALEFLPSGVLVASALIF